MVMISALGLACGSGKEAEPPAEASDSVGPARTAPPSLHACNRQLPPAQQTKAVRAGLLPAPTPSLAVGNPFTTPLPTSGVPLHDGDERAAFRNELRYLLDQGVQIEQDEFSASLYIVERDGDVFDTSGRKKASGAPFVRPSGPIDELNAGIDGRGWPLQAWMQPDPGEGHMAIYNPQTGAYGEFFSAEVSEGRLTYGWGGFIGDARRSQGMSPCADPWWGATAFGLNLMSFTITDHEIRRAVQRYRAGDFENAYIPHLIGYEANRHHPNEWYYPATKTDDVGSKVPAWGVGGDPDRLGNGLGVLRMGGILRIDPAVDVHKQIKGDDSDFGDMMARIVARTLQVHGATMTDQTQAGFALVAEHSRNPDGNYDEKAFDYSAGAADNGEKWLAPMLRQVVDQEWAQFVYTGRNLDIDEAAPPPEGAYRPGSD